MRYVILALLLAGCTTGTAGNITGSALGADNAATIKALAADPNSWCFSASNPMFGPIKIFRAGAGVTSLRCDGDSMTIGTKP